MLDFIQTMNICIPLVFTHRTKNPIASIYSLYCVSACASSPFRFQSTRYLLALSLSLCLAAPMCIGVFLCVAALSERKNHVLHAYGALLLLLLLSLLIFSNCHHIHTHTYNGLRFVRVAYAFNDSVEPIGTVRMRVCFVWNGITNGIGDFFLQKSFRSANCEFTI